MIELLAQAAGGIPEGLTGGGIVAFLAGATWGVSYLVRRKNGKSKSGNGTTCNFDATCRDKLVEMSAHGQHAAEQRGEMLSTLRAIRDRLPNGKL